MFNKLGHYWGHCVQSILGPLRPFSAIVSSATQYCSYYLGHKILRAILVFGLPTAWTNVTATQ